jgi:hypothetical protein
MYILPEGRVAYFDVDDTLVEWEESGEGSDRIAIQMGKFWSHKKVIRVHVDELIRQKKSGTYIVVWSAGGSKWAEAVVKALNIEEYVDAVLTKPDRVYDDKSPSEWLPKTRNYNN